MLCTSCLFSPVVLLCKSIPMTTETSNHSNRKRMQANPPSSSTSSPPSHWDHTEILKMDISLCLRQRHQQELNQQTFLWLWLMFSSFGAMFSWTHLQRTCNSLLYHGHNKSNNPLLIEHLHCEGLQKVDNKEEKIVNNKPWRQFRNFIK